MAKTIKKESKVKTTPKKKEVIKETVTIENIISPEIENNNDEPVLVNEKNEIIYNPQEELKKVMENFDSNIPTDLLEDDVKEGLDFLKNNISIPSELENNIEKNIELVEKQMEELTKIKDNIIKNTNGSKSNYNFTSFWNGTANKW